MAKQKKTPSNTIASNKKARFDFFIEEDKESYVIIHQGELYLHGAHLTPLATTSTHKPADPVRPRKLLMKRYEINRLIGQVERAGYTLAPLSLYWARGRAKLKIGLAKGKKQHDKRASIKDRDWKRDQQRILKGG